MDSYLLKEHCAKLIQSEMKIVTMLELLQITSRG